MIIIIIIAACVLFSSPFNCCDTDCQRCDLTLIHADGNQPVHYRAAAAAAASEAQYFYFQSRAMTKLLISLSIYVRCDMQRERACIYFSLPQSRCRTLFPTHERE